MAASPSIQALDPSILRSGGLVLEQHPCTEEQTAGYTGRVTHLRPHLKMAKPDPTQGLAASWLFRKPEFLMPQAPPRVTPGWATLISHLTKTLAGVGMTGFPVSKWPPQSRWSGLYRSR